MKDVIQLYAIEFHLFSPFSPHSPTFKRNFSNELRYASDGVYKSEEGCNCNKGLIEAFLKKLFNFIVFSFGYLVIYHPTPLGSHAFVAMQSIMVEMGFVGQGKLACAIRA